MINLAHKPVLFGEKVVLRPFKDDDFTFIEECLLDPEVIKLTGSTSEYDREYTLNWYETRNEQTNRLDLAIVDQSLGILVGEVVLNLYDEESNSMNFRILIGPRGRNRGLGKEATRLIIDYAFQNTTLSFITLGVYAFNPRARHVYEKIGFEMESIDERDLEYDGEWIDSVNMKLTRDRWLSDTSEYNIRS